MREDAIRRYAELSVPRYTSYPTAADFSHAITPQEHASWLRQLAPNEPVSLYLYIPYCRQLCDDKLNSFIDTLLREVALVCNHLSSRPRVVHLHWGGTTPSILAARRISQIMNVLRAGFDFDPAMEHTITLDQRSVTPALVQELTIQGVNRASLNVHDVGVTVRLLRDAGIEKINFDLLYGLPLQTLDKLSEICAMVAAFSPDRVACYSYAHLPRCGINQQFAGVALLADAEQLFAQSRVVADCFEGHGYEAIGIDHFALPNDRLAIAARDGGLNRNYQGYTDDSCQTLIGLGPSSISQFRGGFVQTISDIGQYRQAISAGQLATKRGHALRDRDRIRNRIITALMCNFKVDLSLIAPGVDFSDELALLRPFVSDALVTVEGGVIAATKRGRPLIRLVAAIFDEFHKESVHGYSYAV